MAPRWLRTSLIARVFLRKSLGKLPAVVLPGGAFSVRLGFFDSCRFFSYFSVVSAFEARGLCDPRRRTPVGLDGPWRFPDKGLPTAFGPGRVRKGILLARWRPGIYHGGSYAVG